MDEVVADLPIQIERAEFLRKFDGQNQAGAARSDAAVDGAVRIIERDLGEDGHGEAGVLVVVETPLYAELVLAETVLGIAQRVIDTEIGVFEGELDAVAEAEIDVDVGSVGDRVGVEEERHIAEVDFPLLVAGGAGVVSVVGRAALGAEGRAGKSYEKKDQRGGSGDVAGDLGDYWRREIAKHGE